MNDNLSGKYISEQDLSVAFLAYVSDQLHKRGCRPTRAALADEIEVEPSMISQIYNCSKALHYRKIAQYAHKIGMPVGAVFLDIARRAGEERNEPSLETPVRDPAQVLSDAVERAHQVRERLGMQSLSGKLEGKEVFRQVASGAFAVLRGFDLPVKAVVVGTGQAGRALFSSCREVEPGRAGVIHVVSPVPPSLRRVFECPAEASQVLEDTFAVICPGELAYEQAGEREKEWAAFWDKLTGLTHASHGGTKLCVIAERVLSSGADTGHRAMTALLYFFEHRFLPPTEVRQALRVFTGPILEAWGHIDHCGPGHQRECLDSRSFREAMQTLVKVLWVENAASWVSRVEALYMGGDSQGGHRWFGTFSRDCRAVAGSAIPAVSGEGAGVGGMNAGWTDGSPAMLSSALWSVAESILTPPKAVLLTPKGLGIQFPGRNGEVEQTILGVPFELGGEQGSLEGSRGVVFLWCQRDRLTQLCDCLRALRAGSSGLRMWLPKEGEAPSISRMEALVRPICLHVERPDGPGHPKKTAGAKGTDGFGCQQERLVGIANLHMPDHV